MIVVVSGERRNSVRSETDTNCVKYYHGVLESKEAARLLRGREEGSFLLRKNHDDEYRITHKVCKVKFDVLLPSHFYRKKTLWDI